MRHIRESPISIWNAVDTKMIDIWESHLSLPSLGKATTEQYIFPMGYSYNNQYNIPQ